MDFVEMSDAVTRAMESVVRAMESKGSPEFEAVVKEVLDMHRRKGADYGTKDDFFANVSASANWGIEPWVGAMMRVSDKVARLQSAAKGSTLQNEGIEDSLLDIATYSIIAVCLFRRSTSIDPRQLLSNEKLFNDVILEERPIDS